MGTACLFLFVSRSFFVTVFVYVSKQTKRPFLEIIKPFSYKLKNTLTYFLQVIMLYLSQYRINIHVSFRLTYRKYFFWLLRNSAYLLGNYLYVGRVNFGTEFLTTRRFLTQPDFLQELFVDALPRHYSTQSPYWRPLLEVQYVRSLEYWSYKVNLNRLLDKVLVNPDPIMLKNKLFLNQTLLEFKYTSLSTDNTLFKHLMLNIFIMSLNTWQIPKNFLVYDLKFVLFYPNLFLIRKINTQLFRIYSI